MPTGGEKDWKFKTVNMVDCSPHGVGILTDKPMKRGEEFLAKVKIQRVTMVIYRVMHCTEQKDGMYKVGAKLVESVGTPMEILQALIEGGE
jgi:hypothetical protein